MPGVDQGSPGVARGECHSGVGTARYLWLPLCAPSRKSWTWGLRARAGAIIGLSWKEGRHRQPKGRHF